MDRVIGGARCAEHRVSWAQYAVERYGERMRPAGKGVAHKRILRAHHLGEHLVERLTAPVVITIAGRRDKMALAHAVSNEG